MKLLDIRTRPVVERIANIDDFADACSGVLNFSTVVGDGWQQDWAILRNRLDELGLRSKERAP